MSEEQYYAKALGADAARVQAAYLPNWEIPEDFDPEKLPLDCISHLIYGFAIPQPNGELSIEERDIKAISALVATKEKHTDLKVLLSIGGGGASANYPEIVRDKDKRTRFACSAFELVAKYGLDGIDINWQGIANRTEGDELVFLLTRLRESLPPKELIITAAIEVSASALYTMPVGAAAKFLDFINLMAYDFTDHLHDRGAPGLQAQLFPHPSTDADSARFSGVHAVERCLREGVPGGKILLGIPCYGRSVVAKQPDEKFQKDPGESRKSLEYKNLPRVSGGEFVDTARVAAYRTCSDGTLVSYDSPETVETKAAFVKDPKTNSRRLLAEFQTTKLGGLFYWAVTGDHSLQNNRSLIRNGHANLRSSELELLGGALPLN